MLLTVGKFSLTFEIPWLMRAVAALRKDEVAGVALHAVQLRDQRPPVVDVLLLDSCKII